MFCLRNKFLILVSVLLLIAGIFPVQAEQQTIDIKAQYLLLDEKKGISKYRGNVFFKKGTLSIKADTVTLFYNNKELTKALIVGSPADVLHYPDNEAKVHSQAKIMEYFVTEERLTLKGKAFVDQGDNHFSGETIEYDTRQRTITAAGNKSTLPGAENSKNTPASRRVHVIIGPTEKIQQNDEVDENDNTEEKAQ